MDLFKLLGTIAIDNSEANKALDDTAKKADETGETTETAFGKIGTAAGTIAKGITAAGAIMGGAWIAAIEGSREYRTEMGKLDTAFVTNGHSSEVAKKTYSDLNAVLGDSGQAVEASQHLATLTDNEKDLQTWTDICTGVYARFGESIPIESLTESANEVAKSGELTGGLVDALVWAGHSEEEFQKKLDSCTTEQQRQKLIMDTLNGTYKESSDQYKKTNKDVMAAQKAQEKLSDAFAEVGRIGEPILTAIKTKVADMVSGAVPHLENFVNKVKDIIAWVKDNQDTINNWVGVIIGAGVSIGTFLLILNWGSIMAAASKAIQAVRTAVLLFNAALLANPVVLVVALLAGLVAAFIYLWNTSDSFRAFWIKLWDTVRKAASDAWNAIQKAFSSIGKWFSDKFTQVQKSGKDAMEKVKKWFSDSYKKITNTFANIGSWFRGKFQSAWSSIKSVFSGWGSFFSGLWTSIKSKFQSIGSSLGTAMSKAVKSGLNKALSAVEKGVNKGIGLINDAIGFANKLGFSVGKVKKISLPRLAQGGVLEQGQVGLLEGSGAEAVVPLDRNKAWIARVAEDMNAMQQAQAPAQDLSEIVDLLEKIVVLLRELKKLNVYLDSRVLVGALTPAIDTQLSNRWSHALRGNTR